MTAVNGAPVKGRHCSSGSRCPRTSERHVGPPTGGLAKERGSSTWVPHPVDPVRLLFFGAAGSSALQGPTDVFYEQEEV